jgi:hypothetical protein
MPIVPMTTIDSIQEHLNSNEFVPHPNGNYAIYGLLLLGCDSIIKYEDDIWKFWAFETGTNNAIYYNKDRKPLSINPYDPNLKIQRMTEKA